jgi:rhodanese-related sulfurtransferase
MSTVTPTTDTPTPNPDAPPAEEFHVGISASELRTLLEADPHTRVLDVRTGGEFQSVHIAGSYNVPLDLLAEHAADLASLEHPVVLVCASGARAAKAKDALRAAGKTDMRVLDGGISSWESAGGQVVRAGEKWALDRQVRGVAGSMVLAGVMASIVLPKSKWLAGAVGGGLLYSAVSNTCAMGQLLGKLPYNKGPECELDEVLASMRRSAKAA